MPVCSTSLSAGGLVLEAFPLSEARGALLILPSVKMDGV